MRTKSRKTKLILFVSFLVYVLFWLVITLALKDMSVPIALVSENTLAILTVIASVFFGDLLNRAVDISKWANSVVKSASLVFRPH